MTVVVSFVTASGGGSSANGIGKVRVQERLAVGGTTTNTIQSGELVLVGNAETSMIAVAFGTTPDAAATADNSPVTSAGFPVAAGQLGVPLVGSVGSKVNVKAVT